MKTQMRLTSSLERISLQQISLESTPNSELRRIKIMPDGFVESDDGTKSFLMDAEAFTEMKKEFDARDGSAVVFDYEHQSLRSEANGAAPAAGWIEGIEFEKGVGVFAQVRWTETARKHILADEYRFVSPAFLVRPKDQRAVKLLSVALTNTPALTRNMDAVAASTQFLRKIAMADETTPSFPDPGIVVGEIKSLLGIENIEDESDQVKVLIAIRDALKGKKTEEPTEEAAEEAKEDTVVAASVREALGLDNKAGATVVTAAIKAVKSGGGNVVALSRQVEELQAKLDQRDADEFLKPYIDKGVIPEGDVAMFKDMAADDPENCKRVLALMMPRQGRTQSTARPDSGSNVDEQLMIDNSVKEHDGNYKNGIIALSTKMINDEIERTGVGRQRAVAVLEEQYPVIFG